MPQSISRYSNAATAHILSYYLPNCIQEKDYYPFHMTVLPISSCPKAFILCIHLISITFCRESSLEARLL